MLNSLRRRSYAYIGKTFNPRKRLNNHNSGFGSVATELSYLRPFAIMAYISGFEGNNDLMLAVERNWKIQRDLLIQQNIYDPKEWAKAGRLVINNESLESNYNIGSYNLRLVLLFKS